MTKTKPFDVAEHLDTEETIQHYLYEVALDTGGEPLHPDMMRALVTAKRARKMHNLPEPKRLKPYA